MTVFICPTGTSILTSKKISFVQIENRPSAEYDQHSSFLSMLRQMVDSHTAHQEPLEHLEEVSAEFKSLVKMNLQKVDHVYLLVSDTVDGKFSAEINKELLSKFINCFVEIKLIPDLQALDEYLFRCNGLKNFVEITLGLISKHRRQGHNIIFNATAGYKALVPYLTILGMVHNLEVKYIFEKSDSVLTLSGLPLDLNYDLLLPILPKLQKIEAETAISLTDWQRGIDYHDQRYMWLIEETGGLVTMSALGLLFYERLKSDWSLIDIPYCSLAPQEKRVHFKKGEDKPPLINLAHCLVNSPYVCEIVNSLKFNPKQTNPILEARDDGILHLVLTDTEEGLGMAVKTTGTDARQTKEIGRLLVARYFPRSLSGV